MKGGLFGLLLWKFQEMLNCKNSKTKFPSSFRYKHCLWLGSTFLFCIMISALFKRCCVVPKKINCIKSIKLCKPKPRSSENSSLISFKKFSILAEFFCRNSTCFFPPYPTALKIKKICRFSKKIKIVSFFHL